MSDALASLLGPEMETRYFQDLAAAFVRGKLGLDAEDPNQLIALGLSRGLRLHKFKRQVGLPRVRRVLGLLRALGPSDLLDVGSGRGTALWPLLDAFPALPVLAVDHQERRALDLDAVRRGGVDRLCAAQMDACRLALQPKSRDVVTALEVLEHLARPEQAVGELVRVARRFVVASVPSCEDENPEHLHLFDEPTLRRLFEAAGGVPGVLRAGPEPPHRARASLTALRQRGLRSQPQRVLLNREDRPGCVARLRLPT